MLIGVPFPRALAPLPLARLREPFDHPEWLFEVKYDGFRALAFVEHGVCRLVSRTGYTYRAFAPLCDAIAATVAPHTAVLDGEIVCLAPDGRPDFRALLFRRMDPFFYSFDLLYLDGIDLRDEPLVARKRVLRRLLHAAHGGARRLGRVRYVDHVVGQGVGLFELACEQDVEGIVAKVKQSTYKITNDRSPWCKVKNRDYSQARDRHELFERRATGGRR